MTNVELKLKSASKIFREGENVIGFIVINGNSDFKHDGIYLTMDGTVNLQISSKAVGMFEAFYNSVKPIQLVHYTIEAVAPGKISGGKIEIPFELPLKPKGNKSLYETYHGVFVNVQYMIHCNIKRSFLSKDVNKSIEFMVEDKRPIAKENEICKNDAVPFKIVPESAHITKQVNNISRFCISGKLDSLKCKLSQPLTGEVVIECSELPIKSIELQLVRVETCGCAEGYSKEATEIQNIQIGQGNVFIGLPIPIYMIFPRLFTCPTLSTSNFKVEFEINLIVIFEDDNLVTENFPITLTRH